MPELPTTPSHPVQYVRNSPVPCVYVEGLSQIMFGFPNSRVVLHNMATRESAAPDATETQNVALEIVIPTAGLLEMCKNVLQHAAEIGPQIKSSGEQWMEAVSRVIDSTQADPS